MKLVYKDAIKLLIESFDEMEKLFNQNAHADDYDFSSYGFYEGKFTPYILSQLKQSNESKLNLIFGFVERLLKNGDRELVNMVGVSVVESLYFDKACEIHKEALLKHCGKNTRQSFLDTMEEFDPDLKAEWENSLAA